MSQWTAGATVRTGQAVLDRRGHMLVQRRRLQQKGCLKDECVCTGYEPARLIGSLPRRHAFGGSMAATSLWGNAMQHGAWRASWPAWRGWESQRRVPVRDPRRCGSGGWSGRHCSTSAPAWGSASSWSGSTRAKWRTSPRSTPRRAALLARPGTYNSRAQNRGTSRRRLWPVSLCRSGGNRSHKTGQPLGVVIGAGRGHALALRQCSSAGRSTCPRS